MGAELVTGMFLGSTQNAGGHQKAHHSIELGYLFPNTSTFPIKFGRRDVLLVLLVKKFLPGKTQEESFLCGAYTLEHYPLDYIDLDQARHLQNYEDMVVCLGIGIGLSEPVILLC